MTDKTPGACQCHEKHAPTYWKGVVREYKDALEKAEQERDEANERAEKHRRAVVDHSTNARCWMQTSEEWQATAEEWEKRARAAEQPRPLTPDAITDEMVLRYLNHSWGATESNIALFEAKEVRAARSALIAALTEPPARPEGAEDIERLLMDADREGGEAYRANGYAGLADYLASKGVRATGGN